MENKGISIIIPVYNFDVVSLITDLHNQATELSIHFEIRCYDDGSNKAFKSLNSKIASLSNVVYHELENNLGRSKIRNKLAQDATFEYLIFIDGDSKIENPTYLKDYLARSISHDLIVGGTSYTSSLENPDHALRWKYGKEREEISSKERNNQPYLNFTINNVFIKREIFLRHQLDENITTYGHEDTKLGFQLKENNIPVFHINNPVEHLGLETNATFIQKTEESVKNLYSLSLEHIGIDSKLCDYANTLRNLSLIHI